jgi:hypothetical protein
VNSLCGFPGNGCDGEGQRWGPAGVPSRPLNKIAPWSSLSCRSRPDTGLPPNQSLKWTAPVASLGVRPLSYVRSAASRTWVSSPRLGLHGTVGCRYGAASVSTGLEVPAAPLKTSGWAGVRQAGALRFLREVEVAGVGACAWSGVLASRGGRAFRRCWVLGAGRCRWICRPWNARSTSEDVGVGRCQAGGFPPFAAGSRGGWSWSRCLVGSASFARWLGLQEMLGAWSREVLVEPPALERPQHL